MLYEGFGPIARLRFDRFLGSLEGADDATIDGHLQDYEELRDEKIYQLHCENPSNYWATGFGTDASHSIFVLLPKPDRGYEWIPTASTKTLVTPYIGEKIAFAFCEKTTVGAQHLYDFLLGQAQTRTAAGWVFESRVHRIFEQGGTFTAAPLKNASGSLNLVTNAEVALTFNKAADLGTFLRREKHSQDVNADRFGTYLKPGKCNLTALDSMFVMRSPGTEEAMVVFFQMTIGLSPPLKACGLDDLWNALRAGAKKATPAVVFVVPTENIDKFKAQPSDAHEAASRARGESRVVGECGRLARRREWRRAA